MLPLPALPLRVLFLLTALLLAAPSLAAPKFDLSPYLGGVGTEGDFAVFVRSTGGERTVTLLEVEPWKKGWRQVTRSEVTGAGDLFDGVVLSESFLIPGKQLLSGSVLFDDGTAFFARRPARDLKLLVKPGKVQRLRQRAQLLFGDTRIGKVERRATWQMDGFETVETPSGTYEEALRARASSRMRLRIDKGDEVIELQELILWYAADLGLVRVDVDLEVHVNGSFEIAESWSEELSSFGSAP
jgi:hypothetical protein